MLLARIWLTKIFQCKPALLHFETGTSLPSCTEWQAWKSSLCDIKQDTAANSSVKQTTCIRTQKTVLQNSNLSTLTRQWSSKKPAKRWSVREHPEAQRVQAHSSEVQSRDSSGLNTQHMIVCDVSRCDIVIRMVPFNLHLFLCNQITF